MNFKWFSFVLVWLDFSMKFFCESKRSIGITQKEIFRLSPRTLMKYAMKWNKTQKCQQFFVVDFFLFERLTSKLCFDCVFSHCRFCVLIIVSIYYYSLLFHSIMQLFEKDLQGAGHNISAATVIQLRVSTESFLG